MDNSFECLGTMSGTSLDGLDICLVRFERENNDWRYAINAAETIPYSREFKNKLAHAETLSGIDLLLLSNEFGIVTGKAVHRFVSKYKAKPLFVASHGHTIFHQPQRKLTLQIGSGASIAAECSLPVICDFRSLDVALGGQGAPLVPIGDELLFSQYDYCLNLGGFANISTNEHGTRKAFDICPTNIVLNYFTQKIGLDFDNNGTIARSGNIHQELLVTLNNVDFYKITSPKSLGKEWVLESIIPIIERYDLTIPTILHTFCEHIAIQIAMSIQPNKTVLTTGGGAYNSYLIERVRNVSKANIIIPDDYCIQYKEALIFAFLGLLRYLNLPNSLKSVTGAEKDSIGGCIYLG